MNSQERGPTDGHPGPDRWSGLLAAIPGLLVVSLLLLATYRQGAFAVEHWAPLAVLALVVLAVLAVGGRPLLPLTRGPVGLAVLAIWGLAGWMLLSAVWAGSPGDAIEGGLRAVLYAALATIVLAALPGRSQVLLVAKLAVGGVVVIALVTYIALLMDGPAHFLAGRLDDPVGYRNATAALFALGFWPLISVAASRPVPAAARAAGLALATLCLGLAFLTQSRGMVLGLAIGAIVALGVGPERLRRAWSALLAAGGVAAFHSPLLTPYDAFSEAGVVTADQIGTATTALGVLVLVAFGVGLLIGLFDGGLRPTARMRTVLRRTATGALAAATLAAAGAAIVAVGNPVSFADDRLTEFRGLDEPAPEETRLTTVGGQRYDLWRVALREARDNPILGVGEGSYRFGYYQHRRTDRNLSAPHSLPLRLLSETGAVGILLFLTFLGAIAAAFIRGWRTAPHATRAWASALAAGGSVVLGQAAVDWLWLIPGLMGLGLVLLCLSATLISQDEPRPPGPSPPWARFGLAATLLAAAAASVALYMSDVYARDAEAAESATSQLDAARTAGRLNPLAITPLYLEAGALEELERPREAREVLLEALDREPGSFVTLGLLGDLEVREGEKEAARARYRQALELNPLDVGLRQLATEAGADQGP